MCPNRVFHAGQIAVILAAVLLAASPGCSRQEPAQVPAKAGEATAGKTGEATAGKTGEAATGSQTAAGAPTTAPAPDESAQATGGESGRLRLATTTSVDNTGLLAALLPEFKKMTGIEVHVLAVGTGQAIKLAVNGDVDVVLVHDPEAEKAFVEAGDGVNPRPVMWNRFVLVGPAGDPAGVGKAATAVAAFKAMADAKTQFVSRGDESGTHKAELRFWKAAGTTPGWQGYMEAGQGMMLTLNMADQKQAYCLVDEATFLAAGDKVTLVTLLSGDEALVNRYVVIPVNPAKHPSVQSKDAETFAAWLVSQAGQMLIGAYKKDGKTLFNPYLGGVK